MIGHYLLSLTPEQEARVLTTAMRAGPYVTEDGCRCLVGAATAVSLAVRLAGLDERCRWQEQHDPRRSDWGRPGLSYDHLCERFGEARINAAIRNRILANQARRVLGSARRALLERAP